MSGKEAVKTAASITGKSTLNKVVASVVTIAIVGAGGIGIHSMKKEEPQKKQDEIVTEQESPGQNINLDAMKMTNIFWNFHIKMEVCLFHQVLFQEKKCFPMLMTRFR